MRFPDIKGHLRELGTFAGEKLPQKGNRVPKKTQAFAQVTPEQAISTCITYEVINTIVNTNTFGD